MDLFAPLRRARFLFFGELEQVVDSLPVPPLLFSSTRLCLQKLQAFAGCRVFVAPLFGLHPLVSSTPSTLLPSSITAAYPRSVLVSSIGDVLVFPHLSFFFFWTSLRGWLSQAVAWLKHVDNGNPLRPKYVHCWKIFQQWLQERPPDMICCGLPLLVAPFSLPYPYPQP